MAVVKSDFDFNKQAQEWIDTFNRLQAQSSSMQTKLFEQISELGKQEEDIKHYIELKKLTPADFRKLSYKLRDIRRERRMAKTTLEAVTLVYENMKHKNLSVDDKVYSTRTNIVEETLSASDADEPEKPKKETASKVKRPVGRPRKVKAEDNTNKEKEN